MEIISHGVLYHLSAMALSGYYSAGSVWDAL